MRWRGWHVRGQAVHRVMGGETEYAISARRRDGQAVAQPALLSQFIGHAMAMLGYSSASTRGRFLRNGGLLYLDAGLHIEWATPECTSPFDVVRYLAAGDRIVHDLASSLPASHPEIAEVFCSRANVDYLSQTSWAAHESYMHCGNPSALPVELMPFLASRVILGAGGWNYRSPALVFTLSPRAHFISVPTDLDSQCTRPLYSTKDEPLAGPGSHRLHVACAESLCSQTANILRFGTTALVLAVVERGVRPSRGVALAAPARAVQQFASDPELTATAPLASGGRVTALAVQRHYLGIVEASLDRSSPPWAEEICALWRRTLDDLACEAPGIESTLDWAIKRRLFARRLERHGVAWSSLRAWDVGIRRLRRTWAHQREQRRFDLDCVLDPSLWMRLEMDALAPILAKRGASWEQVPALATARKELFELDAKYGGLGEDGVFNALDRAGAVRDRVQALDVESAVLHPPKDTRARIRGDVVRRLSEAGTAYGAEWTGVFDKATCRELDLSDPFETEEIWRDVASSGERR